MKDLIDFARRRPVLTIAIVVVALALAIVSIILGAKIWQSLLGLLGVGVGATQPLKAYAKKDAERVQGQAEIDGWKQRKLADIDQTRMKDERKIHVELGKKHNAIDKATETETPEQMRKRLLDAVRGPLQCVLWIWLWIGLTACSTTIGAPGSASVVRDVCFSKQEVGDILKRIETLKAVASACESRATHSKQIASVECQALVARWRLEARTCSDKLTACSARTCPTCWLPWLLVGVVSATAIGVGVYAGVHLGGIGTR